MSELMMDPDSVPTSGMSEPMNAIRASSAGSGADDREEDQAQHAVDERRKLA
jgi:hypothetical protein